MREYQGSMTNTKGGCTYSRLRGVCRNGNAVNMAMPSATYVVPKFCPSGPSPNYPPRTDTLTHAQPYLCGGYFDMRGAYPDADCFSCKQTFTQRACGGNIRAACEGASVAVGNGGGTTVGVNGGARNGAEGYYPPEYYCGQDHGSFLRKKY